jgi:addiction module HigA family antidote
MTMHNPPHPGEFIRETYIEPFDISIRSLAENLGVAASTLARVVSERSAVSPEMALRLSKALGRSPESWLAMHLAGQEVRESLSCSEDSVCSNRVMANWRSAAKYACCQRRCLNLFESEPSQYCRNSALRGRYCRPT